MTYTVTPNYKCMLMILFSFAFEYILKMEYAKLISVDFLLQAPENPRRVSGASCKST